MANEFIARKGYIALEDSQITGSLSVTNSVTASFFTGSFRGDGSQLTGISTDPFPYTGSAIISGSLNVIGSLLQNGAAIETDPFPYTGSAIISGSLVVTGSLNASDGVTGSFTGSFVGNGSGLTGVVNATTASYVELSNVNGSASLSTRLTGLESFSSSLDSIYATDAQLNAATSSLSESISSLSSSFLAYTASQNALNSTFATTASFNAFSSSINSFTASQNALNATFATTGSNTFFGTQVITGSLFISNNLIVQGSSSLQNITASVVSIGTNTVILNTDTPSVRFGGISVQDSGSGVGASGSLFWDSQNNHWLYQHPTGGPESAFTARLISGPANSGSLGNELGLTPGKIPVASGDDHLSDSIVTQATNNLSISVDGALSVTGSVNATQGFTGSFTGSFTGTATNATSASFATSASYAVSASHVIGGVDPFPYTGSAIISGSLVVTGSLNVSGGVTGSFTGSFRGDGSSLTGLPPGYSVTNSSDNRIITSVDSTTGNAEANLTFDGTVLNITGNVTASGGFSGSLSGNASTATILQTARTIGGVSFNGSANINLPGVNTTGNQDTSGNAASATVLQTARTIGGVSFNGSANINLPGVNTAGNQDTSGTATNATNFNVEADDSTNSTHFIIFTGGATGNQRPNSDTALTYNPSTNLLSAGCFIETSALRCKSNIQPINSPLDKVKQLKPITFDWKNTGKNDIGFIAEEVKDILPNLIHYNEEGEVEGMNYSKITSLLVAAIQEQQEQINELKQEINNLKNN